MSDVVIITGMHRSGTSLIASLLQKAGLAIGDHLLEAGQANPRGFFEDVDFYRFHERALHERGLTTFAAPRFSFSPTDEERERAKALIAAREQHRFWGWKDPRTSLFLDFWAGLLPNAKLVLVYRHPLDVLLSLVRRADRYAVGLVEALDAWLTYNTSIKAFAEAHRDRVILCNSYRVVDEIGAFATQIHGRFGVSLDLSQAALEALYKPDELKRPAIGADVEAILERCHPESMRLFRELEAMAELAGRPTTADQNADPGVIALRQAVEASPGELQLARRRVTLLSLVSLLEPDATEKMFVAHLRDVGELEIAQGWLSTQIDNWKGEATRCGAQLVELRDWAGKLDEGKAWLEQQRASWQAQAEKAMASVDELRRWIAELDAGKQWHEKVAAQERRRAEEAEARLATYERSIRMKLLSHIKLVPRG